MEFTLLEIKVNILQSTSLKGGGFTYFITHHGENILFLSKQLNVFIIIAEEKSYSKAAKRLFLTVPPVFKMLREIEEWIGAKLFENVNGTLLMTKEGQEFYNVLHPVYLELINIKTKKILKSKKISLTSDDINSDLTTDLCFYLISHHINFLSIREENKLLPAGDIHVSTTKQKYGDDTSEITVKERMAIWCLKKLNNESSEILLVQDNLFYQGKFYNGILKYTQEIGRKVNGIIIDNVKVRKNIVARGIAVSIDNFSWWENNKNISRIEIPQERETFIYIKKTVFDIVNPLINKMISSRGNTCYSDVDFK
ncbi:LysR family transcriptional regulator [Serratia fonticola]|uniref:LysR family transcriptional regulator n=1 Tax=Serratia fonticola TaxID=47917 RepID=A0AAJ1YDE5_SERFO|nr:LysR family transcriptional regulator [Serratia fonticola]MDQ9128541.1 LysR family transcriptional regulator [Serratia fonticola]